MRYVLALDQGTTSSRAVLIDHSGSVAGMCQREFRQIFPRPSWVEHDPEDIFNSQIDCAREVLETSCRDGDEVVALGIANQRETLVVWDRHTGKAVYNAIVWQCRRTAEFCDSLKQKNLSDDIHARTGLAVDAYFSGPKIRWILDNVSGARDAAMGGDLLAGTVDSWLLWRLTGGKSHLTDYSNASRTMLFNIVTLDWDDDLLELIGVPRSMLPEVRPSIFDFGSTDQEILGRVIPVGALIGDQQAALFGNLCLEPGTVKTTYGTGAFVLANTADKPLFSRNGLLTTVAWGMDGKVSYALEGSVFMAGATIQWLRDSLGLIGDVAETEKLAASAGDSQGVYLVPAFQGLGTPYWSMDARGAILGMTRGTGRGHIVRAALESIAHSVQDVLEAMEDSGIEIRDIRVDGGASSNDVLMQMQADFSRVPVVRPLSTESTAIGAAYAAGLSSGFWKDARELGTIKHNDIIFRPEMGEECRERLRNGWKNAVSRCL
ncbi:MAG: glycerol kinase GlpK [Victivallales bacterium]|nr:glycerol kinase GlpK [Victivallales bacterium]